MTRVDGHGLPGRPGRRHRPVRRPVGRGAVRRSELHAHRQAGGTAPTDLDADGQGPVRRPEGPRGARPDAGIATRSSSSSSTVGPRSATTTSSGRTTRTSTRPIRSGPATSTRPRRCSPRPVRRPDGDAARRPAPGDPRPGRAPQEPGRRGRDHPQHRAREPRTRSTAPHGARPSRRTRRAPGAADLGIVDYGHRATPDVYLNAALKSKGIWNSSQYGSTGVRRGVRGVPGGRRCRRPEGGVHQDRDDPERRPPGRRAVLLQLPGRQLEQVHRRLLERARTDVLLDDEPDCLNLTRIA